MTRGRKVQLVLIVAGAALLVVGLLVNLVPATPKTTTTTIPCGNPPGTCSWTNTTDVYPYGQFTGLYLIIAAMVPLAGVRVYQQHERNKELRTPRAQQNKPNQK